MACWACRSPLWPCPCTWCCRTTTPARWVRPWRPWGACCWAPACWTRWSTPALAGALLTLALWAVFMPQVHRPGALLVWAAVGLALAYPAYSLLSITHQAWGARLGGNEAQRGRVVAWREGAGLLGVVLASVLPTLLGVPVMLGAFSGLLVLGWLAWHHAPVPKPLPQAGDAAAQTGLWQPWRQAAFRRLMGVFVLNGI